MKEQHDYTKTTRRRMGSNDAEGEVLNLVADPDVLEVASFMQKRFAADRLIAIAKGVADLAPLLWGEKEHSQLRLEWPTPT
jgi:hypothetical protein